MFKTHFNIHGPKQQFLEESYLLKIYFTKNHSKSSKWDVLTRSWAEEEPPNTGKMTGALGLQKSHFMPLTGI